MPKLGTCSKCNLESVIVLKNRITGKLVCRKCRDFFNYLNKVGWKNCIHCGKYRRVAKNHNGYAVCYGCYRNIYAVKKNCTKCGREKVLSTYEGQLLCSGCRSSLRNSNPKYFEECAGCHNKKTVATRTVEGIAICHSCYRGGFEG